MVAVLEKPLAGAGTSRPMTVSRLHIARWGSRRTQQSSCCTATVGTARLGGRWATHIA